MEFICIVCILISFTITESNIVVLESSSFFFPLYVIFFYCFFHLAFIRKEHLLNSIPMLEQNAL